MGRVLYSWKDLQDLAGYTARVSELMDTMSDIRTGKFKKSMIASASEEGNVKCKRTHSPSSRWFHSRAVPSVTKPW